MSAGVYTIPLGLAIAINMFQCVRYARKKDFARHKDHAIMTLFWSIDPALNRGAQWMMRVLLNSQSLIRFIWYIFRNSLCWQKFGADVVICYPYTNFQYYQKNENSSTLSTKKYELKQIWCFECWTREHTQGWSLIMAKAVHWIPSGHRLERPPRFHPSRSGFLIFYGQFLLTVLSHKKYSVQN